MNHNSNMSQTDMSTSQEALEAMQPKLSNLHQRIMLFINRSGFYGATDAELQANLGLDPKMNARTRRKELVDMGMVIASGFKRKGRGRNGEVISRIANVWVGTTYKPTRTAPKRRLDAATAADVLAAHLKKYAKLCRSEADDTEVNIQGIHVIDARRAYTYASNALRQTPPYNGNEGDQK